MSPTPVVHVATMQKNEGVILSRWLQHYAALFGYGALTIYDNCSTDPLTLSLLFDAESRGARIYRNMPDYRNKHLLMLNLFRRHDARPNRADFYLPVDCDEYLIALTENGVSFEKDDIVRELNRHRHARVSLQIPGSFYNDPGREGAYVLDRPFIKSFFRSGAIGGLDIGFHFASSGLDEGVALTGLIYLHHHNKHLEAARETARAKLRAAEAIDHDGPGANYLRWLINCPDNEYLQRYNNRLRVTLVPGETPCLLFPDGREIVWDGQAYLRLYPEVRDGYGLGSLHHYLSIGHEQQRALKPRNPVFPASRRVPAPRWLAQAPEGTPVSTNR